MAAEQESQIRKYIPGEIEEKWQTRWDRDQTWRVTEDPKKKKFYNLSMFPYPSGRLHMGHVRNYTISDVIARFMRSKGFNVLNPMGWDAFGLPAENAAIKHKKPPEQWTLQNIETMRVQFNRLGLGFDWTREVATCLPNYYRWEQKFFIDMFNEGLAYRKASTVNWCPSCQTVLANEQVEDGKCWRCDSETTTRELEQWCLKTTQYAQELLDDLKKLEGWPERVIKMQEHWIGRSTGTEMDFALENGQSIRIFTTRPDTVFGVTYMAIAPEHPLALELCKDKEQEGAVQAFVDQQRKQDKIARTAEDTEKEGVFTGAYAKHPLTGGDVPIFVANFVLMDYGTGALMAVPAHDTRDHAFAKKYKLEIKQVIQSKDADTPPIQEQAFTGHGTMVNSASFDGMESEKAKKAITDELIKQGKGSSTVQYRMRDWGLSRQRYWGAPIPMIHCEKCGIVPVPDKDLPVTLPKDVELSGEGGSPLKNHPDFTQVACPKCSNPNAKRETDTMDTFMESSWYYLRYTSPGEDSRPFDPEKLKYWLSVDQYVGGIGHATMHLLYFRFFHKALRDLGYLPKDMEPFGLDEPVKNLINQGIVYKDGAKMSKSKGNVVEPDEIIRKFGADTARIFSMFAAPPEKVLEWSDQGAEGGYRFLNRVWRMIEQHYSLLKDVKAFSGKHSDLSTDANRKLRTKVHQTIEKFEYDFAHGFHFNMAIAAIMELVNEIYTYDVQMGSDENKQVLREAVETTIRLLHPFAPHITEELWEILGHQTLLVDTPLPAKDAQALVKDTINFVVQVNGKLRANIQAGVQLEKDKVIDLAKADAKVAKHLEGKNIVKTIFVPKKLINFVAK